MVPPNGQTGILEHPKVKSQDATGKVLTQDAGKLAIETVKWTGVVLLAIGIVNVGVRIYKGESVGVAISHAFGFGPVVLD